MSDVCVGVIICLQDASVLHMFQLIPLKPRHLLLN